MDKFTHKTLITTPYDLTYSYYLSPNFSQNLNNKIPVLLLNHGYPDEAYMWNDVVSHLQSHFPKYPIIVPDILGFAGSSKPTDARKYNYKQQADSLAQILDAENVPDTVVPIGHDWGSAISQRFYLYHKSRCIGLCLISLAYQPPSTEKFSLDEANEQTEKQFGYPQWEYWNFFTAPDAPKVMRENLDRFYDVNHGNYPSPDVKERGRDVWMREMFCTPGAMREYITGTGKWGDGKRVDLKPYAENPELRKRFVERMSRDGLEGPVCYYISLANNTMLDEERDLCHQPNDRGRTIEVPLLYIGQTGDWVCRTDLMSVAKDKGLIMGDLDEKVVDAGHWVMYEKPEDVAKFLVDWLQRKFHEAQSEKTGQ